MNGLLEVYIIQDFNITVKFQFQKVRLNFEGISGFFKFDKIVFNFTV